MRKVKEREHAEAHGEPCVQIDAVARVEDGVDGVFDQPRDAQLRRRHHRGARDERHQQIRPIGYVAPHEACPFHRHILAASGAPNVSDP